MTASKPLKAGGRPVTAPRPAGAAGRVPELCPQGPIWWGPLLTPPPVKARDSATNGNAPNSGAGLFHKEDLIPNSPENMHTTVHGETKAKLSKNMGAGGFGKHMFQSNQKNVPLGGESKAFLQEKREAVIT